MDCSFDTNKNNTLSDIQSSIRAKNDNKHDKYEETYSVLELQIIKELLKLAPHSSSRESRKIQSVIGEASLAQLYNSILFLNKATNKELVHYLGLILKFPLPSINIEALVNLKFTAQDKYLGQAIYTYFKLIEHYYTSLSYAQRLKIFYRYNYLFSSNVTLDPTIYLLFKDILKKDFLDFFIGRSLYLNFPFIKDFIVDFTNLIPESAIKIGYDIPILRPLVYRCSLLASNSKNTLNSFDWLVKRWNINMESNIPNLFYRYDCSLLLDSIGNEAFCSLESPLESIKEDLKHSNICSVCLMQENVEERLALLLQEKQRLARCIDEFNNTSHINAPLNIELLRLLPSIDLTTLGNFLCKEKNLKYLEQFTETFEFKNVDLLDALKCFMASFVMNGESQVIDRVMSVFSREYVRQNVKCDSEIQKYYENCKKLAYGFIVLNTMFFNPSFDKKPSFDEYISLLGYNESVFVDNENAQFSFAIEDIKGFYENIKENEMKIPTYWSDGYDKFTLFKKTVRNMNSVINIVLPLENNPEASQQSTSKDTCLPVCDSCVIVCYKHLFKASCSSFMFLSAETFFEFTSIIQCKEEFEHYLDFHRKNTVKFLDASKIYLENFIVSSEFIDSFFDVLEKTEKPKAAILSDLKHMFGKQGSSETREKQFQVLSHFTQNINTILEIRFLDRSICTKNCLSLQQHSKTRKRYVKQICSKIISSNADNLEDFSSFNDDFQFKILCKDVENNISLVSDKTKVKYILQELKKGHTTEKAHHILSNIKLNTSEAFEAFCLMQQWYDDFDKLIHIEHSVNDSVNFFTIHEEFASFLTSQENVLKLFTSTSSILNIKVVKRIHRDCCPLTDPKFQEFNKILYLILKCNEKDLGLQEYASCIINYLSDSLILLLEIYEYIFPVFLQISKSFSGMLIKILIKRSKIFIENGVECCASSKDQSVAFRLRSLFSKFINHSLLSESELKSFSLQCVNKVDVIEL
ncbi:hypothetical protein GINT2_001257 [Glugoides intestinalis]